MRKGFRFETSRTLKGEILQNYKKTTEKSLSDRSRSIFDR